MGRLLAQAAALPNLLGAWDCLQGRLPEAVQRSYAWRLEDHLLDLCDAVRAGT